MKKTYTKPEIRNAVFNDPIMLITASVHDKNTGSGQGTVHIGNNPDNSGDMWNDARSKGGRGFWDDEE